jgi:hypothetical protein
MPSSVQAQSRRVHPRLWTPFLPPPPSWPLSPAEPETVENPKPGFAPEGKRRRKGGERRGQRGGPAPAHLWDAFVVMAGRDGGVGCEDRLVGGWEWRVGGGREGRERGKGGEMGERGVRGDGVGSCLLALWWYNIVAAQISILCVLSLARVL